MDFCWHWRLGKQPTLEVPTEQSLIVLHHMNVLLRLPDGNLLCYNLKK